MTDHEEHVLMRRFDHNGDGKISMEEFYNTLATAWTLYSTAKSKGLKGQMEMHALDEWTRNQAEEEATYWEERRCASMIRIAGEKSSDGHLIAFFIHDETPPG